MCYRFFCFSLCCCWAATLTLGVVFFFCVYIICCEWINKFFFVRLLLSAAAAIWERSNERGNLSKKSRLCSDCVFFLLCFAVESWPAAARDDSQKSAQRGQPRNVANAMRHRKGAAQRERKCQKHLRIDNSVVVAAHITPRPSPSSSSPKCCNGLFSRELLSATSATVYDFSWNSML